MGLKDIHNLDYAVLLCERLDETRRFYADVMGFPVEHESETWICFRTGATLLTLRPRGPGPAWEDGPAVAGSASVQLAFRVPPSAIDACHAELVAAGAEILRGPTDLPAWNHRTIFFRDPEGNLLEIYAEI
ncbi:VOC family protein [Minwuia sp.]|uniref:VOC family protein n=1 Tax=Minwuia sp. TaxID=2493630 RepID=UPI003A903CAA